MTYTQILGFGPKAHPNIFGVVILFQSEQAATEVTLMQLAAGGPLARRRSKYRLHEKRLLTIKEKYMYEAGDYTLTELLKYIRGEKAHGNKS